MPELPEVETIKRQLAKKIISKKIKNVEIRLSKIAKTPAKDFKRAIFGSRVKNVKRRAKLIIIELSSGYSLLIHLKMTGQLILLSKQQTVNNKQFNKHTHVIFHFSDGSQLLYNDLRQFGYVKLIESNKLPAFLEKEYGPEPLDENFTLALFSKILNQKPRAKIKQFLMDQKNIAGIGNLYADEILFFAKVMPIRKISSLSKNEIKKIYFGIIKILNEAIKARGSSVENYLDANGKAGEYHLRLKVYGREKRPCLKCKTLISKIKLNGRGTHFCPKCQK